MRFYVYHDHDHQYVDRGQHSQYNIPSLAVIL